MTRLPRPEGATGGRVRAQELAPYLNKLRLGAGKPTIRTLAGMTSCGRTTIQEALAGRRPPTWNVTQALVTALDGDLEVARTLWANAHYRPASPDEASQWLIRIRSDPPKLVTGRGLVASMALAHTDPLGAIEDGWEVIRLSAMHVAGRHYGDLPGNWSSNVVATFRRTESDNVLPSGVSSVAEILNRIRIDAGFTPEKVSVSVALQYVALAYQVAYQTYDILHGNSAGAGG